MGKSPLNVAKATHSTGTAGSQAELLGGQYEVVAQEEGWRAPPWPLEETLHGFVTLHGGTPGLLLLAIGFPQPHLWQGPSEPVRGSACVWARHPPVRKLREALDCAPGVGRLFKHVISCTPRTLRRKG